MPKDFDDNIPTIDLSDNEDIRNEVMLEGVFGKAFKAKLLAGSLHEMMMDGDKPVRTCIVQFNALLKFSDFNELEQMADANGELLLTAEPLQGKED